MDETQSEGEKGRSGARRTDGGTPRGPVLRRPTARAARTVQDAREWAGWLIAAAGAALCVLGWYGVSGESFAEQQIPYLASSTIPGAALIVSGVVLVALRSSDRTRGPTGPPGEGDLTSRRVERLYALLVEPDEDGTAENGAGESATDRTAAAGTGADAGAAGASGRLAVPGGTLYHRPDCPLVAGKPDARPVDDAAVRARGLTPCRLCEPGPPTAPADTEGATRAERPTDTEGPDTPPTRPGDTAPPTG